MTGLLIFLCNGVLGIAFVVVVAVFAAAVLVALIDPMTPPETYDEPAPEPVRIPRQRRGDDV